MTPQEAIQKHGYDQVLKFVAVDGTTERFAVAQAGNAWFHIKESDGLPAYETRFGSLGERRNNVCGANFMGEICMVVIKNGRILKLGEDWETVTE